MFLSLTFILFPFLGTLATPIIYDGRAPFDYTAADFDNSVDPYLTVVKGSKNASQYTTLLGHTELPTPLWNRRVSPLLPGFTVPVEQVLAVSIDNSSVFIPGGSSPQFGFRRTDVLAQKGAGNPHPVIALMENNVTIFHVSVKADTQHPLNFTHEYQIVFIEPNDGSHIFEIQLGSPFTNPTRTLPASNAHSFKVRDHALNLLFQTPFTTGNWHNFAVQVDWNNLSLSVLYSTDDSPLKAVTGVVSNPTAAAGPAGQGDYHFTVLKLPLVNPADSPTNQGDVVHFGIQEGTKETLLYSGVFVESVQGGISVGGGRTIKAIK